jgi:hypothetical protein
VRHPAQAFRSHRPAAPGLVAATVLLFAASPAFACPSCFGQAQGPLIDAARLGIWLLLAVTLCLQGAFAAFFLYLRRRAASCTDLPPDERWSPTRREGTVPGGVPGP